MKLSEWLQSENISQRAFAARVGASPAAVTRWVSGARKPRFDQATRIAAVTSGAVTAADFGIDNKPLPRGSTALRGWMRTADVDVAMAATLFGVDGSTVRKWLRGERTPHGDAMAKINGLAGMALGREDFRA